MADEHKYYKIFVEGTPHEWPNEYITYADVVTLEVPDYSEHPKITYTVKYKEGPRDKPAGLLPPDATTKVLEGMIFSVTATGAS